MKYNIKPFTARFKLSDGKGLSKRIFEFETPTELRRISLQGCNKWREFIGVIRFHNTGEKNIIIAANGELIYFQPELLEKLDFKALVRGSER